MNVIKHCRKSLLYHNEELWIKKGVSGNFNDPMDSYDSVEISEVVECLLLYKFNDIIDPGCHGFYRDDGLMIINNPTGNIIRKKLFNKFGFKLDI